MVKSDDIHFVLVKKKQKLRIKTQIGSFIRNNRVVGEEADNHLKHMNFTRSFWNYDPFGVISELMVKQKRNPYAHVHKLEVEKYMNQADWQENTFLETEENPPPVTASHTKTPQVQIEKKTRKEVSHSVIEVLTKDFQVYRNRDKTSHTRDLLKEGEIQSTIVMEGPHSSTFSGSQFIVSTYSSKKQTYTTLLVDSSHEPTGSIIFYKYKLIKEKEKSVQMVVIPL